MSNNTILGEVSNRNIEVASGLSELLESMATPEAGRMAAALRQGTDEAIAAVGFSKSKANRRKQLTNAFKEADNRLKGCVSGTYAFIQGTDEELYAKLPPEENWSEVAGGTQAQHLLNALLAAGKDAKQYVHPLEVVLKMRQKAEKELVALGTVSDSIHDGHTAVVKLRMLIAQADVIIRGAAKPGTPLYDLYRKVRFPKAKHGGKKAKGDGKQAPAQKAGEGTTPPAPEQHQAGGSTSSGTAANTTPAPAPVPAPSPAPAPAGDSAGEVAVVGVGSSVPAMLNGVHA